MATATQQASGVAAARCARYARARGAVSIALLVSVALTAVVTAVLAAFAVYFYLSEKEQRWDQLRQGLANSADELAAAVTLSVWNFDEAQIITIMKSGLSNRGLHASMVAPTSAHHPYILQRNEAGQLVSSLMPPLEPDLLVEKRDMVVEGQSIGVITLYASPAPLLAELRQRSVAIAGMIVVLDLALVAGLYLLLWHVMLKPLRAIGRYAGLVQAGLNADATMPRAWYFGELKGLYGAIRQMVGLLQHRYGAMHASEQRLQIATRAAGIGIWDWNVATGVADWDDQMFRLYGARRELVDSPVQLWRDMLHPDDVADSEAQLRRLLDGSSIDSAHQFRIVWPDGAVRHIQTDSLVLRAPDGRPLRMVGVNYDITAHKLAQQELERHRHHLEELVGERTRALSVAVAQAQAANQAKSVFLANMSHELRTPLHSVIGFSRMVADAAHMQPEDRRNLAIIEGAGQHLLVLINDILELSRIEAGRAPLQVDTLLLPEMLRDVTDMVSVRAAQAGLKLVLDSSGLPPRVRVDGTKLRQVLLNLLSNAVKFTRAGSVRLEARAAREEQGGWRLSFAVSDTGPGIALADQQRIFEPFIQAGHGGAVEGTGLGLAISREFVQLMGGALTVQSAPGQGATFRFSVNADSVPAGELAMPQPPMPQPACGGVVVAGTPAPAAILSAPQLARLPPAVRVALRDAVLQLNLQQVHDVLAPLPEELDDVVAVIEAMLQRHAYPQLCALLGEQGIDLQEPAG